MYTIVDNDGIVSCYVCRNYIIPSYQEELHIFIPYENKEQTLEDFHGRNHHR